jgi:hypothetical protein
MWSRRSCGLREVREVTTQPIDFIAAGSLREVREVVREVLDFICGQCGACVSPIPPIALRSSLREGERLGKRRKERC